MTMEWMDVFADNGVVDISDILLKQKSDKR